MGILYESLQQEREDLRRWLEFWNVPTQKREAKIRRFYEVDNELRVLRLPDGDIRRDINELAQIHYQSL